MKKIVLLCFAFFSCSSPMGVMAPPSLVTNITNGPTVIEYDLKQPRSLGKSKSGQEIYLGGFSGLRYLGKTGEGKYRFLTHTDRGPNADSYEEKGKTNRPFLLPTFQPRIVYFEADPATNEISITKEIPLLRANGKPISGLPQNEKQEHPVDLRGNGLAYDKYGLDLEGIALDEDGTFWMVDEYGPSVLHFSSKGQLMDLLRPERGLPKVLMQRRLNRGFEGVARYENSLYAIIQSPLDNPPSKDYGNSKKSNLIRILEIDLKTLSTKAQFAYLLESSKTDKIGDIAIVEKNRLLVIEQDGKSGSDSKKKIFEINLEEATNLQLISEKISGLFGKIELMDEKELRANKIIPVSKKELFDLAKLGIGDEKAEGLDIVDGKFLAVIVDNDFGVGGELNRRSGKVPDASPNTKMYFIPLPEDFL